MAEALSKLGYTFIRYVKLNDPTNPVILAKVYNPQGQKIYVNMDSLTTDNSEIILNPSSIVSDIPYSTKYGTVTNAGSDLRGLVFEGDNNALSIIQMNIETLAPKETNYIFDNDTKSITNTNKVIPYPLLNLKEILMDPNIALNVINMNMRKIRANYHLTLLSELTKTKESVNNLNNSIAIFDTQREQFAQLLINRIQNLETELGKISPSDPKYLSIQNELKERYENIDDYLLTIKHVDEFRNSIDKANRHVQGATEFLHKISKLML